MSTQTDDIRKQLAQDHTWQQQENFWIASQDHNEKMQRFFVAAHEATEANRREQERHWRLQQRYWWLVVGLGATAVIINGLAAFFAK